MTQTLALIGFGEAGSTFARAAGWGRRARGFDIRTVDFSSAGVEDCSTLAEALAGAGLAISVVTADNALTVARDAARHISRGAFYFDLNSVAPDTKRAAAEAIEEAGGIYIDVAVMAPVHPAGLATPMLLSGAEAQAGIELLARLGFTNVRGTGGDVGRASMIKMLRSVMVKGFEALTAECLVASARAGVVDEVLGSFDGDWATGADYRIDRMLVHGTRRSAEMAEVVKTLEALGVEPLMTSGTVGRQARFGALHVATPPEGLEAKLAIVRDA